MLKNLILIACLLLSHFAPAQNEPTTEICLTNNKAQDRYASYSPDGKWIVFESNRDGNWGIYLMDSNGKNLSKLTDSKSDNRRPTWHPNGKKILFESTRNGSPELFSIKIKNNKERKVSHKNIEGELIFAQYAPKGNRIAASLKEAENQSSIVLLNKRGKIIQRLTNNDKRNFYPQWSNDGKQILFFSRKDTDNQDDEIYRLDLSTNKTFRLTNWHKHNFCPSWSNDNKKIVYVTSMEGNRPEIYIMDHNGNNKTRLTNNNDGETLPNWHPKENKILVTAYRNGNYEICELTLN